MGGFDPSLRTHEDWDLWLRVARSGAAFTLVRQRLSYYRSTPGSLTRDAAAMSRDYEVVLRRGQAPDPRLVDGGLATPRIDLDERLALAGLWNACLALGAGAGVGAAIACLPPKFTLPWSMAEAGGAMVDGWAVGASIGSWEIAEAWTKVGPVFLAFLEGLDDPQMRYALLKAFEREAIRLGRFGGRATLHRTVGLRWRPDLLLLGVRTAQGADEVLLRAPLLRPRWRFMIAIPVWGGRVSGGAVRVQVAGWLAGLLRQIASDHPWRIAALARKALIWAARRVLSRTVRRRPQDAPSGPGRPPPTSPALAGEAGLIVADVRAAVGRSASDLVRTRSAGAPEPDGSHAQQRAAWNAFFEDRPDP